MENKEMYLKLDIKKYNILKEKSAKMGLKPTSYTRMLIYQDLNQHK